MGRLLVVSRHDVGASRDPDVCNLDIVGFASSEVRFGVHGHRVSTSSKPARDLEGAQNSRTRELHVHMCVQRLGISFARNGGLARMPFPWRLDDLRPLILLLSSGSISDTIRPLCWTLHLTLHGWRSIKMICPRIRPKDP